MSSISFSSRLLTTAEGHPQVVAFAYRLHLDQRLGDTFRLLTFAKTASPRPLAAWRGETQTQMGAEVFRRVVESPIALWVPATCCEDTKVLERYISQSWKDLSLGVYEDDSKHTKRYYAKALADYPRVYVKGGQAGEEGDNDMESRRVQAYFRWADKICRETGEKTKKFADYLYVADETAVDLSSL